jgi:hypothetical protein
VCFAHFEIRSVVDAAVEPRDGRLLLLRFELLENGTAMRFQWPGGVGVRTMSSGVIAHAGTVVRHLGVRPAGGLPILTVPD